MSVDANVGVELLVLVTDITEVNPVSLCLSQEAFSSPKGISPGFQVYDDGKCTKMSSIKRFLFQN